MWVSTWSNHCVAGISTMLWPIILQKLRWTVSYRVLIKFECIVHIYPTFISIPKQRCKILHWVARASKSLYFQPKYTAPRQKLPCILWSCVRYEWKSGNFCICILRIQYALQIYLSATSNIFYSESALCNLHFDFKTFDMAGINANHVLCFSLERYHSVGVLVIDPQYWWLISNCHTQLW